jgi:hypothetical protein
MDRVANVRGAVLVLEETAVVPLGVGIFAPFVLLLDEVFSYYRGLFGLGPRVICHNVSGSAI